jgi:starch synthase
MYVVQITPECAPVAKVGGLGDVVQGLSNEIAIRGNHVEIILPKYDCMRYDMIWDLQRCYSDLWVPYHNQWVHCDVYFGSVYNMRCFFIETHSQHNFFNRGVYYGNLDDAERFAFFCRASLEFLFKSGRHPEIIHCHDWQTGLVPVLLFEMYKNLGMTHPRVVYTLHNLGHQGVVGEHILRQVGLNSGHLMTSERARDHTHHTACNLMKAGVVYSNFVTTVSPRYAHEIQHTDLGRGLQSVMHTHANKIGGVLNGIDYSVWNPEIDPHIQTQYGFNSLQLKFENKDILRQRFLLRDEFKPIISIVSRLDPQKGVDLIRHAIFYALNSGCQFILLGAAAEASINHDFWNLKRHLNENPDCHLEIGYDDYSAHLIYAGSDMVVIPSAYEPCGLTQMIAMKYGTVPIVRNTGGLADTVFDANHAHKPFHERNGYVFNDYNNLGLESAMRRAIGLWYRYPEYFRQLRENGMRYDYSWNHPGSDYLNIYNHVKE